MIVLGCLPVFYVKAYAFLRPYRSPLFCIAEAFNFNHMPIGFPHIIQQTRTHVGEKMEATDANNMEKYRSYIQKRRVSPEPVQSEVEEESQSVSSQLVDVSPQPEKSVPLIPQEYGRKASGDYDRPFYTETDNGAGRSYTAPEPYPRSYSRYPTGLRRTDQGHYKSLYQNRKRQGAYVSPYRSHSGSKTDIADNRATLLAIKLIKQALACFAILGIIVLMQGRSDMEDVLAFIKRQVVETHIDPQGIYEGIQGFIAQCSKILGGSP